MNREMKDSGVQWIGEIPENWEISKISQIYKERSKKVSDKDFKPLSVTKKGIVLQLENVAKTDNGDNRKLVKINDFVINSRSDRRGSCGISPYNGSVSLINTVLEPKSMINNTYYSYVFRSENFADEFYKWGHGIVDDLWSTKWGDMKNIYIPFPDIKTQEKIANYLDEKVSEIDNTISKTKGIIEKYKKYKQSLITETVTKGLNKNVEMKNSGIEWLDNIPSHWQKATFNYKVYIRARLGWKGLKADEYIEDGYILLATPNIKGSKIDFENVNHISKERYDESPEIMLSVGDVLLTKDGSTLGTVNIVRELPKETTVNGSIAVLTPLEDINSIYLYYYLKSDYIQHIIQLKKDGMGVPHLFQRDIKKFNLLVPSKKEQREIANYLDKQCLEIDSLISKKEKLIVELESYKKSLIYEAVMGKRVI